MRGLPTINELTNDLRDIQKELAGWGIEDTDVRLQFVPAEGWALHTGDPCYDQDHRGYWGAAMVTLEQSLGELRDTARSLIDEVRDSVAIARY